MKRAQRITALNGNFRCLRLAAGSFPINRGKGVQLWLVFLDLTQMRFYEFQRRDFPAGDQARHF